jgi:hypothetical protein
LREKSFKLIDGLDILVSMKTANVRAEYMTKRHKVSKVWESVQYELCCVSHLLCCTWGSEQRNGAWKTAGVCQQQAAATSQTPSVT